MKRIFGSISCMIGLFLIGTACPLFAQTLTEVEGMLNADLHGNKEGGLCWADFNNDGFLDLAVNTNDNSFTQKSRLYHWNAATTQFDDVTIARVNTQFNDRRKRSALAGDFDNDGDLDFMHSTSTEREIIYENTGAPNYDLVLKQEFTNGVFPFDGTTQSGMNNEGLAWMDFDGDGDLDVYKEDHQYGQDILEYNVTVFDSKLKRADRYYNNFEYKPAIKLYLKLVEKNKANDEIKLKLAQSYLKVNSPVNAEKWFSEVIHSPAATMEHKILYAQTLLRTGKYEESRKIIEQLELAEKDYRSQAILTTLQRLDVFYGDSIYYAISPLESNNNEFADFSPVIYKDGIVFVSSRPNTGHKFKRDNPTFLDLYFTGSGDFKSATPFSNSLNSKYNEGPVAFYDNFNKIIFTRSNCFEGELGETIEGVNNLQLYTAQWNENIEDWDQIKPIAFSINNYSYGHPAISEHGQQLYFISDMPGGFGGTDIYVSEKLDTGWTKPRNLGEVINTAGNEMYPQIEGENLFFASNGHGGLGGLDIYQCNLQGTVDIKNMGYPVNTPADDFAISFVPQTLEAYISSDREGEDNIYKVEIKAKDLNKVLADNSINSAMPDVDNLSPLMANTELSYSPENQELEDLVTVNTQVIDAGNQKGLNNTQLKLLVNGMEMQDLQADENGQLSIQVPQGHEYELLAIKEGFQTKRIIIPSESLGEEEDILILMRSDLTVADLSTSVAEANSREQQINSIDSQAVQLDPLAVPEQRLTDSGLTPGERPILNGVALQEVPELEQEAAIESAQIVDDEIPASNLELEPLAVKDQRLTDSGLTPEERPILNSVVLQEVPELVEETSENELVDNPRLNPLAVPEHRLTDSGLTPEERPTLNSVVLQEVPELVQETAEDEDVDNWKLDPLAVRDQRLTDSGLTLSERPILNGVALQEVPELVQKTAEDEDVDNWKLDPLAVRDQRLTDSGLTPEERPTLTGVALQEVPEFAERTSVNEIVDNLEIDPPNLGLPESSQASEKGVSGNVALQEPATVGKTQLTVNTQASNQETSGSKEPTDQNSHRSTIFNSNQAVTGPELPQWPKGTTTKQSDESGAIGELASSQNLFNASQSNLVDAMVFDANNSSQLQDAEIKIYIDSPNEFVTYELRNGVLTFEAVPGENYLLVASHKDYQDAFVDITGEELLNGSQENIKFLLKHNKELDSTFISNKEALKFKTVITDQQTGKALDDAHIKFFVDGRSINSYKSKPNGKAVFKTIPGKDYMALVIREGYQDLIFHVPPTSEDQKIELAMYLENLDETESDQQLLTSKGIKLVNEPGFDKEDINLKIFENGQFKFEVRDLQTLELDPESNFQIVASKPGYKDQLLIIDSQKEKNEDVQVLSLNLKKDSISESGAIQLQDHQDSEMVTLHTHVLDALNQMPLSEARIKIFLNDEIQEINHTWDKGQISFDAIRGEEYTLLVTKEGFEDQLVALGSIDSPSTVTVNLIPHNRQIQSPEPIDMREAQMMVLTNSAGEEEIYISTEDQGLYRYQTENGNHYLVNDEEKIVLKERNRIINSKVQDKQDSDTYNLRSEDPFLYDKLKGDEKAIIDQLVAYGQQHDHFDDQTELAIYYYNLTPEYQQLVDNLIDENVALSSYKEPSEAMDTPVENQQTPEIKLSSRVIEDVMMANHFAVAETFNINNIYYDFDKSYIRDDAAIELDKIVALMKSNKAIKLGMLSHTDSRGSNAYNQKLSEQRARSVLDYLVARGIDRDRLVNDAVGERQLVNSCNTTIVCSEDDHQLNRRTEFRIMF